MASRGRPKRQEPLARISLRNSTFKLWNERKEALGISGITNSEFAEILLHQNMQDLRDRVDNNQPLDQGQGGLDERPGPSKRRRLFQSTPAKQSCPQQDLSLISLSPVNSAANTTQVVDVTGSTVRDSIHQSIRSIACSTVTVLQRINPAFATEPGDPFEVKGSGSDNELEGHLEYISDSAQSSDEGEKSDEETESEDGNRSDDEETVIFDSAESSATVTALEIVPDLGEDKGELEIGPRTLEEQTRAVQSKVQTLLNELQLENDKTRQLKECLQKERVIVDIGKIEELFQQQCLVPGCSKTRKILEKRLEAGVLTIVYTCPNNHFGTWYSSDIIGDKRGQKIFATSTLIAALIIVSGNNYEKINLFAKGLNLSFVSSSFFNRIQTHYVIDSVKSLWDGMKAKVWGVFTTEQLVVSGDGRMDSPGFSAKYCVYTMMEQFLNVIVDLEVIDKRETGGTSPIMEKMACKRLLERMIGVLNLQEFTTDASSTIMKLVRELKELHIDVLEFFFHNLDVWHKAVKLTAKISAAAKIKGCEALADWVQPVRNHFWHCAEACKGDAEVLKDMWIGVIHHVCGEHKWDDGECSHGPMTNTDDEAKKILAKNGKAAGELRKIVFDPDWLKSLKHYVNFRHTSNLENFNSMLLKYAPKRIAFSYEVFRARIMLAALDHNFHLFRKILPGRYKKVYSKRSKNWHVEPVKEEKQFSYWIVLLSDILHRRVSDKASISRRVVVSPTNPQNLAPTIAMREAPPTAELVEKRKSRFKK